MATKKAKKEKKPEDVITGNWLKEAMDKSGKSTEDVMRAIDCDNPTWISAMRNGWRGIPDLDMFKLAKLMGVPPYAARPRLLEYVEAISEKSIVDGLNPDAREQIYGFIALFRAQAAGNKQAAHEQPAATPIKRKP